jgi:hypothetical protein
VEEEEEKDDEEKEQKNKSKEECESNEEKENIDNSLKDSTEIQPKQLQINNNKKIGKEKEEIEEELENEEKEEEEEEEEELSAEEEEFNYEEFIKDNNNKNKKEDSNILILIKNIKRKPIKRELYENLVFKMYNMANKAKNRIELPEKHSLTKYDNTLNQYIKSLEDKIIIMKNAYIETLVKKHFEKDKNQRMRILLKGNIPKTRNDVKKSFKELMNYIESKKKDLGEQNQKYYYILIMNMLKKYQHIGEDEIKQIMKKIMKKRYNKKIRNEKKEKKDVDNDNKIIYNNDDRSKINKGFIFKIFTVMLPLAYIFNYAYANLKV